MSPEHLKPAQADQHSMKRLVSYAPTVVALVLLAVVIAVMVVEGPEVINRPGNLAAISYLVNAFLSLTSMVLVVHNLYSFKEQWTHQERDLHYGLFVVLLGSAIAYFIKAFDRPTLSPGTVLILVGLLLIIQAEVRPPVRFTDAEMLAKQHQDAVVANAGEIAALFSELDRMSPCPDPGCTDFRHRAKVIMEKKAESGASPQ